MYRNRIVITSLQEDLMNIGLLPKNKKFLNEMVDEMVDEGDEDMKPMDDEDQVDSDSDSDMDSDQDTDHDSGDSDDVHDADQDMDDNDDADQYDDDQEPSDDDHMDMAKKTKPAPDFSHLKMGESRERKFSRKATSSLSRSNALLEEVQGLINNVNGVQRRNALKSFANISIISERLSRSFVRLAKALDEEDLRGVARTYRTLSENSGRVALALQGNLSVRNLDESFKNKMNILLQGLDLFEDICEACKHMSDEDETESGDEKGDIHVDVVKGGSHDFHHKHSGEEGDEGDEDTDDGLETGEKDEDLY